MTASVLSGKVQTVLGPVEPGQLGVTLTHEHLLIDTACYFLMPDEASERGYVDAPFTMALRGRIGGMWYYNRDTTRLWDVQAAIEEVSQYRHAGGGSLVDATSVGIARDPIGLARIARATGLNVIMGAGHYVPVSYPPDMDQRTEQAIARGIIGDITAGVGETGVRSGIIGEVGNFWPTTDNQRKVLRAAAHAQQETGAPILIHPGFHSDSPMAIMGDLIEAGADPRRVIMGHLGILPDREALRRLAETGCFLEYDTFGAEDTQFGDVAGQSITIPSDVQRMEFIQFLIEQGYGDKVVIGQDVFLKNHCTRNGGKGYAHILENIVPRMRRRGFTQEQITAILVDNPRRVLTFE